MSIAEKLTTIADNEQKVYKAGQNSMIDKSKIIELTETGTFINLREVSEVPHKIKIVPKGDSATVKVIKGRNLFNEAKDITKSKSYNDEWYLIDNYSTLASYVENNNIPFYAKCDLKAGHCYYISAIFKHFKDGSQDNGERRKSMYISYHGVNGKSIMGDGYNGNAYDNSSNMFGVWGTSYSSEGQEITAGNMVIPYVDVDKFLIGNYSAGGKSLMKKGSIMIVETQSEHKEARQPYDGTTYTIGSEGIEIDSISPQIQFLADSEIEVTYHKSYGAQLATDRRWNDFTLNGGRNSYAYAFYNQEAENFKLERTIKPTDLTQAFNSNQFKIIKGLNTSKCTNFQQMCTNAHVKIFGEIDTTSASTLNKTFSDAKGLTTVKKLILKDDGSQTFTTPFYNCSRLENITIEGTIGNNITFAQSTKLTHDSLMSIIEHLKDFGLVYSNDSPTWDYNNFTGIVSGQSTTINATIEEGKEYTVRIKDNAYGDEQESYSDSYIECRDFDFFCDVANAKPMTYKDGYLEVTIIAEASASGNIEVGVITDYNEAELSSIEIRQTPTTTKTLTLGTTLQAKLTEAEIAIATQKGWTIA